MAVAYNEIVKDLVVRGSSAASRRNPQPSACFWPPQQKAYKMTYFTLSFNIFALILSLPANGISRGVLTRVIQLLRIILLNISCAASLLIFLPSWLVKLRASVEPIVPVSDATILPTFKEKRSSLIGILHNTHEYFTFLTPANIMVVENWAAPRGNTQPSLGCQQTFPHPVRLEPGSQHVLDRLTATSMVRRQCSFFCCLLAVVKGFPSCVNTNHLPNLKLPGKYICMTFYIYIWYISTSCEVR